MTSSAHVTILSNYDLVFVLGQYPVLHRYCEELLRETHPEGFSPELQAFYAFITTRKEITASELDSQIKALMTMTGLGYSQAQNRVLRALGFRSPGIAYKLRTAYSTQRHAVELLYPNLWYQFAEVPYLESILRPLTEGGDLYTLPYLEMLYEPILRGYEDVEQVLRHNQALFDMGVLLQNMARQKTMSLPMLRTMGKTLEGSGVIGHRQALNLAALAMGFKNWPELMKEATQDHVVNRRHKWSLT